jgi:hypothetical protein
MVAAGKPFNALAATPVSAARDVGSRNGGRDEVSLKPRKTLQSADPSQQSLRRDSPPPRWMPDATEGDEADSGDTNLSNCSERESAPETTSKAKPQLVGREEALKAASRRKQESNNSEPEQAPLRRIKQKLDCDKQKEHERIGEREKHNDKVKMRTRKKDKGQEEVDTVSRQDLPSSQHLLKESKKRHRDDKAQEEKARKAPSDPRLQARDRDAAEHMKKVKKKKLFQTKRMKERMVITRFWKNIRSNPQTGVRLKITASLLKRTTRRNLQIPEPRSTR